MSVIFGFCSTHQTHHITNISLYAQVDKLTTKTQQPSFKLNQISIIRPFTHPPFIVPAHSLSLRPRSNRATKYTITNKPHNTMLRRAASTCRPRRTRHLAASRDSRASRVTCRTARTSSRRRFRRVLSHLPLGGYSSSFACCKQRDGNSVEQQKLTTPFLMKPKAPFLSPINKKCASCSIVKQFNHPFSLYPQQKHPKQNESSFRSDQKRQQRQQQQHPRHTQTPSRAMYTVVIHFCI